MPQLLIVPFITLPRKKWKNQLEKKTRVIVEYEERTVENDEGGDQEVPRVRSVKPGAGAIRGRVYSINHANSSRKSVASMARTRGSSRSSNEFEFMIQNDADEAKDLDDILYDDDDDSTNSDLDLLTLTDAQIRRKKLHERFTELNNDPEVGFFERIIDIGIFNYFMLWRKEASKERLHHILKEYEMKIADYDLNIKESADFESATNKRNTEKDLELLAKHQRNIDYTKKMKNAVALRCDERMVSYDRKEGLKNLNTQILRKENI